jgi:hypothetical protein
MSRVQVRALVGSALLPAALLLAVVGPGSAFASDPTAHGSAASGSAASRSAVASAHRPDSYTMRLSSTSATVRAGAATTTVVSFRAGRYLRTTRVALSVTGLPGGVTATFCPPAPLIGGDSVLTLTTASSGPVGAFAITVTAITLSSDPIGTSATFDLAINA